MKNADRLLRVIYKDSDLEHMMDSISTYSGKSTGYNLSKGDGKFMSSTASLYTKAYPSNYSKEEAENILSVYLDKASRYSLSKEKFTSAYHLFFYCAEQLFSVKNSKILVNFDNLLEWDGFLNKVDANIMVAAFMALQSSQVLSNFKDAVIAHDNETLNKLLKQEGAADNHIHLKASGYSAEMSWAALVTCSFFEDENMLKFIRKSKILNDNFARDEASALLLLKKIKFIRLVLEDFLQDGRNVRKAFTKREIISILTSSSDAVFQGIKCANWIASRLYHLEQLYVNAKGPTKYFVLERRFLSNLFSKFIHMPTDPLIQYLFEIYLASLSHIRFFFVQDNVGMGFDKFKQKENVKDDLLSLNTSTSRRIIKSSEIYSSAFDRYYRSEIVKYAEFRIAPQKSFNDLRKTLSAIDAAHQQVSKIYHKQDSSEDIEYGIIIHYIRPNKEPDLKKRKNSLALLREKLKKEAATTIAYLERNCLLSNKIVGIDAANYEIECRPEVLAPIFRHHREILGAKRRFGFTYHVGESFEALASGLRAIDEVIEFMFFKRGDRLGHAVALGINVDLYKDNKRNSFAIPLQNHVDNLAWMYAQIQNMQEDTHKHLLHYLSTEFKIYANQLCADVCSTDCCSIDIEDYLDSWVLRSDDPQIYLDTELNKKLKKNYYYNLLDGTYMFSRHIPRHERAFNNSNAMQLHKEYLHPSDKHFSNGQKLIAIEPADEYWKALKVAQKCLKDKIYLKEIAIETNPSSNRKISHISKFIDLPLWTFNRHHLTKPAEKDNKPDERDCSYDKDLPISINTDDCAIFQTDLANEYALIVAALQREGYNFQEIYDYIDYLRDMSILQTFVDKSKAQDRCVCEMPCCCKARLNARLNIKKPPCKWICKEHF